MEELTKKIAFWVRLAGWICLFPAAFMMKIAQTQHSIIYPIMLGVIVLFAAFLLATGGQKRWQDPRRLQGAMIFSIIFVALLPTIPLYLAYRDAVKLQQQK
ncbi:MAG: hypothetical protein LKH26_01505 [Lactobacillus sp.]|jgi:hypothetical protein|nr:hypothetical protein [Lactobacillus sp.]MCH3905636.1 hypothetical protein [Lactobacillus sp.]MCI1466383.1 hypothetical protein [Lactobacillus sp.]MCI1481210.1 hypothetical protein [Lactobacillus sp.]MCI1884041.1 hypothetical protein [Lactobacillus sp.]